MLNVQQYILKNGLKALELDLAIKIYEHPTLPLVGLKYDQIGSPRQHPVVRECRGIVLEKDTWKVVAKAFNRFFNVGEADCDVFDWSEFICQTKEDGSLILLYHYNDEWHVNTSGSFGLGEVGGFGKSWRDLFWETAKIDKTALSGLEGKTLVFELCTPYNQVVRHYKKNQLFLLSVFDDCKELSIFEANLISIQIGVDMPPIYSANDFEKIKEIISQKENEDPTWEGLVVRDKNNNRLKCKSQTYVSLHHIKDNGNILLPKRLVPIVLSGEYLEVVAVMPEITSAVNLVKERCDKAFADLLALWNANKEKPSQKEFALAIKDNMFSSMLFTLRKENSQATEEDLKKIWKDSAEKIADRLFQDEIFNFDTLDT